MTCELVHCFCKTAFKFLLHVAGFFLICLFKTCSRFTQYSVLIAFTFSRKRWRLLHMYLKNGCHNLSSRWNYLLPSLELVCPLQSIVFTVARSQEYCGGPTRITFINQHKYSIGLCLYSANPFDIVFGQVWANIGTLLACSFLIHKCLYKVLRTHSFHMPIVSASSLTLLL